MLAAVAALALAGAGCGRSPASARGYSRPLPAKAWALSADVTPPAGGVGILRLGRGTRRIAHAEHVEAVGTGGRFAVSAGTRVGGLLVTLRADRGLLLLHRLAELQSRVPPGGFLLGTDARNRLHLDAGFWTRGFLAGALWRASALGVSPGLFRRWALARTRANLGAEGWRTHDLGFLYGESSLAAWQRTGWRPGRASALRAARGLRAVLASNPGAGTLPTRPKLPSRTEADTIVDSLMNLPLLVWDARVRHDARARAAAARAARGVARLLVRPDGGTTQSVHLDRRTGRVLFRETHQGLRADSTWARGQGWALYGLTVAAGELQARGLRARAEAVAGFVRRRLPASGIPRWDYDAPAGALPDTSAGAVSAAGLYRLAELCASGRAGRCAHPGWWAPLAHRMLAAILARASTRPPLGFIPDGVGTHGKTAWDDRAELSYALDYTVEAVGRQRAWLQRHGTAR